MKRYVTFFIVLAMLISLVMVGCGTKPADKTEETTAATTTAVAAETTASEEKVEISYYVWQATTGKHPDEIIAAFQKKYPNITVNAQVGAQDVAQYDATQKMKLMSGDIDITEIRPGNVKAYVDANLLKDITDAPFLSNYADGAVKYFKSLTNDKLFVLPEYEMMLGIYYNKKMFADNGWKVPNDLDEWFKLCQDIKKAGINPFYTGGKDGWTMGFIGGLTFGYFENFYQKNPDFYSNVAKGTAKYTDQVFVDVLKSIDAQYKQGWPPKDDLSLANADGMAAFKQGKCAFWSSFDVMAAQFGEPTFELGIATYPVWKAGEEKIYPVALGSCIGIAQKSKKQDAAMKFAEFQSQPENAAIIANSFGGFPCVKGVKVEFNGIAKSFTALHAEAASAKTSLWWNDAQAGSMFDPTVKALQGMFTGKMTPEQAAKSIQDQAEKTIVGK